MIITPTKSESMLFDLLRAALKHELANPSLYKDCTADDWTACYKLSVKHGVMALSWDGILTLPTDIMPPVNLRLKWGALVEEYEKRYRYYCKTVQALADFYASHGIAMVQMKGVGFSSYYPVPEHREGGDIDIYTYSADKSKMSDSEANALADKLMEEQGIEVSYENDKHSVFIYHGISVENHKSFLDVGLCELAKKVDAYLRAHLSPHPTSLLDGEVSIQIPSTTFNNIFILYHALYHCSVGLCLHQICDCACLLNKGPICLPEVINDACLSRGIRSITSFTNQYLGTNVTIENTEEDANELYYEMFRSPFLKNCTSGNYAQIFIFKARRFWHVQSLKKKHFGESICRAICTSVFTHIRKPYTIFKV